MKLFTTTFTIHKKDNFDLPKIKRMVPQTRIYVCRFPMKRLISALNFLLAVPHLIKMKNI